MILNCGLLEHHYCHTRQFKVDENTLNFFKMYVASADKVIKQHQQMYTYVEEKMKKLRLGLKSYRYFDQAKQLADKVRNTIKRNYIEWK